VIDKAIRRALHIPTWIYRKDAAADGGDSEPTGNFVRHGFVLMSSISFSLWWGEGERHGEVKFERMCCERCWSRCGELQLNVGETR